MTDGRDHDLRERFARERQRDGAWTPAFERVRSPREVRRRGVGGWLVVAVAGSLVLAVVAVARLRRPPTPSEEGLRLATLRLGEWRTPTDFLLDVSGAELLRSVPDFGTAEGWFPLPRWGRSKP